MLVVVLVVLVLDRGDFILCFSFSQHEIFPFVMDMSPHPT